MKAIEIPILLSVLTVFSSKQAGLCASIKKFENFRFSEISLSTSSSTFSPSDLVQVDESLPKEVDVLNFYRHLLNLHKNPNGYAELKTFYQTTLGNATSPIEDADYKTLIKTIKATRNELKLGDNSLKSLNAVIWLTSFPSEVIKEIVNLIRVINKHGKEVVFGLKELARDLAFRRLPRQRKPNRVILIRRRRNGTESEEMLLEGIKSVASYFHILCVELRESHVDMEKARYDQLNRDMRTILAHNLNEFYVEVGQSHLSDVVVFLKVRFDLTMRSIISLLYDAGMTEHVEKQWEGRIQVVVEKMFGQVVEILAVEERGEVQADPITTTPRSLLSEEQFLSEIQKIHIEVWPLLKENFNNSEEVYSILNETSVNLTLTLLNAIPDQSNISTLTTSLSRQMLKTKENLQKALQAPGSNIFDGENIKLENLNELLMSGLEGIIQLIRNRYQETKSNESKPINPRVLDFVKSHVTLKSVFEDRQELVEQIAWSREEMGDYQFQEMMDYLEMFWNAEVLSLSNSNEQNLMIKNPQQLAKIILKIRDRFEEIGVLTTQPFNFLQHLSHYELDSEETHELFEVLRPLISVSSTSSSMSEVVKDLAHADFIGSKDDGLRKNLEAYYQNHTFWNPVAIHESFEKFERLQKKVKSPLVFKKFMRSFGTLLAKKVIFKRDFSVFDRHFFERKPQVLKCSEILTLLKCGARLLTSFDKDVKKVLTILEIFNRTHSSIKLKTFESVDRIREKLGDAYSMLPYFLNIYANDSIQTRALYTVSRVAYDENGAKKVLELLQKIDQIDNPTFIATLQFLTSRPNPYTNFAKRVSQAVKEQSLGSITLHETFGVHVFTNTSFSDTLRWYEELVDLVNDDVALADWITSLHQVATTSRRPLAEYTRALVKVLSETKSWTPIQMAHEEIHEIFGDQSLNRSELFAPFMNLVVDSKEKMREVLTAFQLLAETPGITALHDVFAEYLETPDVLQSTLEVMGIYPEEYQSWNNLTQHYDDFVDLLSLAKSHSHLQRLLNAQNDFLVDSKGLRRLVGYLEIPKGSSVIEEPTVTDSPTTSSFYIDSSFLFDLPIKFLRIANIPDQSNGTESSVDLSSLKKMWASLVKVYGQDAVMRALSLDKVTNLLELLGALTEKKT